MDKTDQRYRILVADDEKSTLEFYKKALQPAKRSTGKRELDRLGDALFGSDLPALPERSEAESRFTLTICSGSTEAVDTVIASIKENKPFAVCFLDVRMPPGPDGVWAAEKIRKIDPNIEIVIATAFSDIHPGQITTRVPPVHKLQYLQKPFHPSEINHMASSLASKWEMEQRVLKMQEQLKLTVNTQSNRLSEAYNALERMQKLDALALVVGGLAHDFNNLLSCIVGHTELALLDTPPDDKRYQRFTAIHDACMKARKLIEQVHTFSRQKEPEYLPLNPASTVSEVLRLIGGSIPVNIDLKADIHEHLPKIMADETQVHQVVMNLCTNAIHAMKDSGGILTVSLVETGERDYSDEIGKGPHILLTVEDTGHGMDEKTIDQIFDPYFTTKEKKEGTGLGLSVTHGIIERQGGLINVTTRPGDGTVFHVVFKALKKET